MRRPSFFIAGRFRARRILRVFALFRETGQKRVTFLPAGPSNDETAEDEEDALLEDLMQRARKGDSEAFVALFERSRPVLWRAVLAVLGNECDAADALQEAAVKAWQAIPRFEGRSNVETWFMRIALRVSFDMRDKRSREAPYAPEAFQTDAPSSRDDRERGGADAVPLDDFRVIAGGKHRADRDEAMDVRRAIAQLPPDDRLVLTLFYLDDFPTQQIATMLNVSVGAVRARLARARSRFKDAYCGNDNQKAEVAR